MHANSRIVTSNQPGIHAHLRELVARHAATKFRKPVADYSRQAFGQAITAWHAAGALPLVLDSGCGVGLSTLNLARRYPGHFVIGVDQSADRLGRNVAWKGALPANCIRVRADLVDFWRLLRHAGIHPDCHYLLYPNPWPKRHHVGRRWHGHPVFPDLVALGGSFECRSNWRIYVEECAVALMQLTGEAVAVERYQLAEVIGPEAQALTPFEQKYLASGHQLWRCRAKLTPAVLEPYCD